MLWTWASLITGSAFKVSLELEQILLITLDALQGPVQVGLALLNWRPPGQDVVLLAAVGVALLLGLGDQLGLQGLVRQPHVAAELVGLAQEFGDGDEPVAAQALHEVLVLVPQAPARVVEHLEVVAARLRNLARLRGTVEIHLPLGLLELAVVGRGLMVVEAVGQALLVPELEAVLGPDLREVPGLGRLVDGRSRHQGLALGPAHELAFEAPRRRLVELAELLLEQLVARATLPAAWSRKARSPRRRSKEASCPTPPRTGYSG